MLIWQASAYFLQGFGLVWRILRGGNADEATSFPSHLPPCQSRFHHNGSGTYGSTAENTRLFRRLFARGLCLGIEFHTAISVA